MTADKRYTVEYSYAGIPQYADFFEKDGKIINPTLAPSYCKVEDVPSLKEKETINEILEVIRGFAYNKQAKIHLINGVLVDYYNDEKTRDFINTSGERFRRFIAVECELFFEQVLMPYLVKKGWYLSNSSFGNVVAIERDEDGEWDNVRDDTYFRYLCAKFATNFADTTIKLTEECGMMIEGDAEVFNYLGRDYLMEIGLFIKPEDL